MNRKRTARLGLTLVFSGFCVLYIVLKIDFHRTGHVIAHARFGYLALALALVLAAMPAAAWRWKLLLRAKGIDENVVWLTRAYLVAYTAGQVLPTAVGGDAARIYETARRHPGRGGAIAASILLERALGASATLLLAAIGFVLAVGRYDIGVYIWIELVAVVIAVVVVVALFSRSVRPLLRRAAPVLQRVWIERHVRSVYEGIHGYRKELPLLGGVTAITLLIQASGVFPIWASAKAVGIDLSPRPYFVMGPLLLLLVMIPFTISGLAIRESFFVSFLGQLSIGASQAFSAGLLFFAVLLLAALPGFTIWAAERAFAARPSPATDD